MGCGWAGSGSKDSDGDWIERAEGFSVSTTGQIYTPVYKRQLSNDSIALSNLYHHKGLAYPL